MKRTDVNEKITIVLALLHSFWWFVILFVCILIWTEYYTLVSGIGFLIVSVWSFVGYKLKWKHIYCSNQIAYREKMTPDNIQWDKMKKSDAYGGPIAFFIFGILCLCFELIG